MQQSLRRIVIGAGFFLATLLIAIIGYVLAGWTLLEAIYMVVITIFGVGYGEVRPIQSPALRVFTMFVIIAGTSSAVYIVGGFLQIITEGEINRALGARRMINEINQLRDHVIICGYGRIGQILARRMQEIGSPFVIVDNNGDRLEKAAAAGYLVYSGNANDEAVLQNAGVLRAKFLATVLPDDASNVFITLTAREMNAELIILARGEFPSTEKKLRLAGADHVVLPATIGALRMAHLIKHPAALEILDRNDGGSDLNELLAKLDVQIDELMITGDSHLVGGTISDIEIRGRGTFIVVALRRNSGETIIHPAHTDPIGEGDTIVIMGHRGDIPQFARNNALKRQMRYRGARH